MPTKQNITKMKLQLIDYDGAEQMIEGFDRRRLMRQLTVLQRQNAKYMLRQFKTAFKRQSDPTTGKRWPPLSPMTLRRREFSGRPILTQTGALRRSLDYKVIPVRGRVNAMIGTQYPTSVVHQFGKNPNVSKVGNLRILYRPIPPRRFVGMSPKHKKRIERNITAFLKAKVKPKGKGTRLVGHVKGLPFMGFSNQSGLAGRWGMRT
jgi:phage virion morphogenesis protein